MKITHELPLVNADKVAMGHKDAHLTLDVETGRVEMDMPVIWMSNAVVTLEDLKKAVEELDKVKELRT